MTLRKDALDLVDDERTRQDAKWGPQRHGLTVWMTVLVEECGEVSERILALRNAEDPSKRAAIIVGLEEEATQVAAVAVAMLEHIMEEASQDAPFPDEVWQ